jgi:hypothetical protein
VIPWVETIREKAQIERISVDVAAISVAQELRNYRHMGGLQKSISIAQDQLKILNITIAQKEKALSVLAELQKKGVDIERLGRELDIAMRSQANGHRIQEGYSGGQNIGLGQGQASMIYNNGNNNPGNFYSKDLEFINKVIEMGQPKNL